MFSLLHTLPSPEGFLNRGLPSTLSLSPVVLGVSEQKDKDGCRDGAGSALAS